MARKEHEIESKLFEMIDLRGRSLAKSVWIPLMAMQNLIEIGQSGHAGYKSEFFSAKTLTIPVEHRATAETLGWTDIGILHHHRGYVEDGEYIPADVYYNSSDGSEVSVLCWIRDSIRKNVRSGTSIKI